MKQSFDPTAGLIVVPAQVWGRTRMAELRLALDTGATTTLINSGLLLWLGYDPAQAAERVQVTTGSGVEFAAIIRVKSLGALGRSCPNLPVLGHTLPPSVPVDGLLGLDFFRGTRLAIDFRKGIMNLSR